VNRPAMYRVVGRLAYPAGSPLGLQQRSARHGIRLRMLAPRTPIPVRPARLPEVSPARVSLAGERVVAALLGDEPAEAVEALAQVHGRTVAVDRASRASFIDGVTMRRLVVTR
jgi:hypothetical protein